MSTDWKTYLGDKTWPDNFEEQVDKWGYLNNPRWKTTPQAPVNYTGNESNEPQIWTPPGAIYSSETSNKHIPCGHWHKKAPSRTYEGQVYVCERDVNTIHVFTTDGTLIRILDGGTTGAFSSPCGVFVYNDEVYITERYGDIVVTDLYGNFKRKWVPGPFPPYYNDPELPIGILIYKDEVYVTISTESRTIVYDLYGNYQRYLQTPADGTQIIDGQAQAGIWICTYVDKLYVTYTFKVQVLNPLATGIQVPSRSWGHWGVDDGGFHGMQGIVCYDNKVFVSDVNNLRIQVFDLSGNYLSQFGNKSYYGLAEYEGEIYVASPSALGIYQGVQVWSLDGVLQRQWAYTTGHPYGIYVYAKLV